jgi:cbb3-type cytochrome oxidase cytochrome c subunit/cytochrome c553
MKMTFKVIVFGGIIVFFAVVIAAVFIPKIIWNPDQTVIAHQYTEQQAMGRKIFYSNGCNYCHTQYVREEDTGMGAVSLGGNYVFDQPLTLGSERTGPDLSYIGRKRSETWEIEHLKDPRSLSPMSIMPNFNFLSDEELQAVASYLFALGDRVAEERMILPPETYAGMTNPIVSPVIQPATDGSPQGWATWINSGLQEGKELYISNCLTCHGCSGNGLGSYGGTMVVTPANFKQEPYRDMPDDQWFWHVSEGVPGTLMPTWKESLTEDQRWKVINYAQQIYAHPVMHDPDEGDPSGSYANLTNPVELSIDILDEGKQIFIRECMVCHGDAGRGSGPYRSEIQPGPPDFGDGSYGDYTDADYFWRISEGVPWSAMPAWKIHYSEENRWKLVHYIRTMFTQTEDQPPQPSKEQSFNFPEVYKDQKFPDVVSFEYGKQIFLEQCAHCHGLAGDGKGWDGQYLNPSPADFRTMAGMSMGENAQGEHLAKVTFGIKDTAMPYWGEWMPESMRWDAIKFLMGAFMQGKPVTESVSNNGQIAANFTTANSQVFQDEGHTIPIDQGADLYQTYCATCHNDDGQGKGPGTEGNASGSPAAYAKDMGEAYIFWRIWEGVPDSVMYPFQWLLSDSEVWSITLYVNDMTTTSTGGN